MQECEITLTGSNSNKKVVRIGSTVRRETSAVSDTVHRLLETLASAGFSKAPKFLGIDENNREILSYKVVPAPSTQITGVMSVILVLQVSYCKLFTMRAPPMFVQMLTIGHTNTPMKSGMRLSVITI